MTIEPSLAVIATALALASAAPALAEARSVVLVHGALLDGSGWRPVHDLLVADGYEVGEGPMMASAR